MKTLKDFTPEIQAKIPEYIKEATEGIFDGKRYNNFNLQDAEKAVNWNYEKCNYKKPVIIVAENIYEQQIFFNFQLLPSQKGKERPPARAFCPCQAKNDPAGGGGRLSANPVCYSPAYVCNETLKPPDRPPAPYVCGRLPGLDARFPRLFPAHLLREGDRRRFPHPALGGDGRGLPDTGFPAGRGDSLWHAGGSLWPAASADVEHSQLFGD